MSARSDQPFQRSEIVALAVVLASALLLNTWHIDFPLGFHSDEPVKATSIRMGMHDFHHPLLLIQLTRVANLFAQVEGDQQLVEMGRWISALAGVVVVGLTYALARRAMSRILALWVAFGTVMSPLLAVHSHYLKEDVLLTGCVMASILAFCSFARERTVHTSVWLGIAAGLALATHYKGVLLIPAMFGVMLVLPFRESDRAERRLLPYAAVAAAALFAVVNWPLFRDPGTFYEGATFELQHALKGHDVRLAWTDQWFSFHLRKSLLPGLGAPALALGLAGLCAALVRLRRSDPQNAIMALVAVVFYLVPELSPLKPWPDYSRYMVPLVPLLMYFAGVVLHDISRHHQRRCQALALVVAASAAIAVPAYRTIRLVSAFAADTRVQVDEWLSTQGVSDVLFEAYTTPSGDMDVMSLAELEPAALERSGSEYAIVSSFMFERYLQPGVELTDSVRLFRDRYLALFRRPYTEFKPAYRSYAFSNPLLRVVDLGQRRSPNSPDTGRPTVVHGNR